MFRARVFLAFFMMLCCKAEPQRPQNALRSDASTEGAAFVPFPSAARSAMSLERHGIAYGAMGSVSVAQECIAYYMDRSPDTGIGERVIATGEGGQLAGFRVLMHRQGVLNALGFLPGDVFKVISGTRLTSAANTLTALTKLRTATPGDLEIGILRADQEGAVRIGVVRLPSACEFFRAPRHL